MFENNKDFYPTPEWVADKMLDGIDWLMVGSILEPSAGKGDLIEWIKKAYEKDNYRRYGSRKLDIDCVEIQPELQHILKGKGYRVVHNDFMNFDTFKRYSLIISNPPFSQGAKHLLKMLDMQERGGGVICLLNAETLKNPYTAERKVLLQRLDDLGADIEYMEGAFEEAERKTDVEVAIVKVVIPEKERVSFIFEETLRKARDLGYKEKEAEESAELAENDFIKVIIQQYRVEVEAGIRLIDEYNAMAPKILSEFNKDGSKGGSILALCFNDYKNERVTYNGFVTAVRRKYWSALFNNPKFTGQLTSSLLQDFRERVEDLAHYDFSEYNIFTIREEMSKSVVKGVEDAIVSLFEELSNKYHWLDETSRNVHYYNGWKTNKSWIINKKVIIPLRGYDPFWGKFRLDSWDVVGKLSDIEKGLNYLDGGLTDSIDLRATLQKAQEEEQTKKIKLKYFTVTFYKKGTCHIEFTNEELLKKFNIFGSQHKGWLPPSYGKKGYEEMDEEEKAVIDEFEGEQEYRKVMGNTGYYICDTNSLLMLEGE